MAKEKPCAGKCGRMINTGLFSSGYLIEGEYYCYDCMKKLPKHVGRECYECAYYGVDANYDGYCKYFNNKYVDRYKKACEKFEKGRLG